MYYIQRWTRIWSIHESGLVGSGPVFSSVFIFVTAISCSDSTRRALDHSITRFTVHRSRRLLLICCKRPSTAVLPHLLDNPSSTAQWHKGCRTLPPGHIPTGTSPSRTIPPTDISPDLFCTHRMFSHCCSCFVSEHQTKEPNSELYWPPYVCDCGKIGDKGMRVVGLFCSALLAVHTDNWERGDEMPYTISNGMGKVHARNYPGGGDVRENMSTGMSYTVSHRHNAI